MSGYYERLEGNLVSAVPRRAQLVAPLRKRRRRARAALAAATLAAGLSIALLLWSTAGGAPAYALVVRPDGSVVLSVRELLGVAPANARLAALGVPVRLVRRQTGCAAKVRQAPLAPGAPGRDLRSLPAHPSGAPLEAARRLEAQRVRAGLRFLRSMVGGPSAAGGRFAMVIHPAAIPTGDTLIIAFRVLESNGRLSPASPARSDHALGLSIELVEGRAPSCLSFDAPAVQRVAR